MKKIIMTLLCVSIGIYNNQNLTAQSTTNTSDYIPNLPKVLPVAPNAASLGQYGNIPVSYFNGTTEIKIPLYEMNIGELKQAVSLSYHSSGIKVNQEASWVGLGWALNAGGCISRTGIGGDDFKNAEGHYYSNIFGYIDRGEMRIDPGNGITVTSKDNPFESPDPWGFLANTNTMDIDGEPDFFNFNFSNYSGSMFFITGNSTAIIKNCKEYLKPTFNRNENRWIVYDGNGLKYYFGSSESSRDATIMAILPQYKTDGNGNAGTLNIQMDKYNLQRQKFNDYYKITTAWYLDSIVAPNGDKIVFEYNSEMVTTPLVAQEEIRTLLPGSYYNNNVGIIPAPEREEYYTYSYSIMKQSLLSKILFKNGEIEFTTSERDDLEADNFSEATQELNLKTHKLEKITIKNNNEEIKSYAFDYVYLGDQSKYAACRLLLNKLTEHSGSNTLNNYGFSYNMGYLPPKNSHQIDFWGYYNQSKAPQSWIEAPGDDPELIEEGTLIPSLYMPELPFENSSVINTEKRFFCGRDRQTNVETIQHGILESIKYPTGGITQFKYEPHEFENKFHYSYTKQDITSVGLKLDQIDNIITPNYDYKEHTSTFTIDKTTVVDINLSVKSLWKVYMISYNRAFASLNIKKLSGSIYEDFTNYHFTGLPDPLFANTQFKENYKITLPPGTYSISIEKYDFVVGFPDGSRPNNVNSNYYWLDAKLSSSEENWTSIGGGLRIKEIKDISDQNTANTRKFIYKKDGISTGHLFITPVYHTAYIRDFLGTTPNSIFLCKYKYLLTKSNPLIDLSPTLTDTPVGYSQVEEIFENEENFGKTIYTFYLNKDLYPYYSYKQCAPAQEYDFKVELNSFFDRTLTFTPYQPTLTSPENGLAKCIFTYDKDNILLKKKSFFYTTTSTLTTEVGGITRFKYFTPLITQYPEMSYLINMLRQNLSPSLRLTMYYLNSEWCRLDRDTTITYYNNGNSNIEETTKYSYDPINYQVESMSRIDSKGNSIENRIVYPTNSKDPISSSMKTNYLFNLPLEKSRYKNDEFLEQQKITYNNFSNPLLILPEYIAYKQGITENNVIQYLNYDSKGNPLYISKNNAEKVCYLWSYKHQYPIAEIKNATYDQVKAALGYNDDQINILSANASPDVTTIATLLRNNLTTSLVTTYTYKPLVGVTSMTDPRGVTTFYEYDSFNRLKETYIIEGSQKKVLQSYDYHYANQ